MEERERESEHERKGRLEKGKQEIGRKKRKEGEMEKKERYKKRMQGRIERWGKHGVKKGSKEEE